MGCTVHFSSPVRTGRASGKSEREERAGRASGKSEQAKRVGADLSIAYAALPDEEVPLEPVSLSSLSELISSLLSNRPDAQALRHAAVTIPCVHLIFPIVASTPSTGKKSLIIYLISSSELGEESNPFRSIDGAADSVGMIGGEEEDELEVKTSWR